MNRNIETWTDYDRAGNWQLHIRKKRGKLAVEEIRQIAMGYEQDFYMLMIKALDEDMSQYFDTDDIDGDFVTLYRADDFFKWREK